MDPILQIARAHDLRVLEDSCETMFSMYKGRPVGSFGDIGCFSTYAAHILVTGVGGIATTSDQELALVMKSFMNHGRDSIYLHIDDDSEADPEKLFRIANSRFSFVRLGHSFRATEMEAALGLAQMSRKAEILARRRMNAQFLTDGLRDMQKYIQLPSCPAQSEHAYMMYPILIKEQRIRRPEFIQYLEQNLIETRYMLPLLNQPIFKKIFGDIEHEYPVAQYINDHGFYVGCHPGLAEGDLAYMVENIRAFISQALT
jgi:dTDP-4-amino-4,6-dideoxygalactose transaminase